MAKRTDDILWLMLSRELSLEDVRELQRYIEGETEFYDMGYGNLSVEPYDARNSLFRLRHLALGDLTVSRSTLQSVLHDLRHELMR